MTTWLDPERECSCHSCVPNGADDGCLGWREATARLVERHGWSIVGVDAAAGVPAWAYTIGLWHSVGSPEIAMFGLRLPDMSRWLNRLGDQIRAGRPLIAGERRDGVIDGVGLELLPVHADWYPSLLGSALNFYQRPPLPIVQAVWPHRTGLFPWEDSSRTDQPSAWLARDEHAPGVWTDLDDLGDDARTTVFLLHRLVAGARIRGVVRDDEGSWQFLDGEAFTGADIATAHLHHVLADQPHLREVTDLRPGEQAWLDEHDRWQRS